MAACYPNQREGEPDGKVALMLSAEGLFGEFVQALRQRVGELCHQHQAKLWPQDSYAKRSKLTLEDVLERLNFAQPRLPKEGEEKALAPTVKMLIDFNTGKCKLARNKVNSLVGAPEIESAALEPEEVQQALEAADGDGKDPVVVAAGGERLVRNTQVYFEASVTMLWLNSASGGIVLNAAPSYEGGAKVCIMSQPEQVDEAAGVGLDLGWMAPATAATAAAQAGNGTAEGGDAPRAKKQKTGDKPDTAPAISIPVM